jgi:YegS/Rv2252/BmrU family lipid kinase
MNDKQLFILINPSAGKGEPVPEKIEKVFHDSEINVKLHILTPGEDPADIVRAALPEANLVAVYGGDGSITEAAVALIGSGTTLAIIPGGTANVISKELGISQDTDEVLKMLCDGAYQFKTIDTATVNGKPFLLRVNLGIMADMIAETDPDLKDKIGQLAYGVSAIKSAYDTEPVVYSLTIDGEPVKASGVSLTITNAGNMGIGDWQMQPGISISDGLLDVLLLKDAGLISIIKTAGSSLLGKETDTVSHWQGKEVIVEMPHKQRYLCDDCEDEADRLTIKIVPASLTVAVPLTDKKDE